MLDKMVQNDVTRRDVLYVAGVGGLPLGGGGGGGSVGPPREIFCKYKLQGNYFRAILKAPRKKAKKVFHRNWQKKGFCLKKKV